MVVIGAGCGIESGPVAGPRVFHGIELGMGAASDLVGLLDRRRDRLVGVPELFGVAVEVGGDGVIGAGGGVNFGWSAWEGTHRYNDDQAPEGATAPVYEYPHGEDGCSVTGGVVYRGAGVPSLAGWYLFADWCSGKLFALPATSEPGGDMAAIPVLTLAQPGPISAIGTDPNGEGLVLGHADGTVYRVVAA